MDSTLPDRFNPRVPRVLVHLLFFLSGAAALGYQLVWTKVLTASLGHEMPAVLAIITSFMAGMALGAALVDRIIPRNRRAGLWLAGLELLIGLWALAASAGLPLLNQYILDWTGAEPGPLRQWSLAFLLPCLGLLPATAAMGATLPAMERFLSAMLHRRSSLGGIYAVNTLGAVAGALATPFLLMPALGLKASGQALAGLNLLVALGLLWLTRTVNPGGGEKAASNASTNYSPVTARQLLATAFSGGLLALGFETVGVRVLSQVLEGTIFTYATTLAVFLLGQSLGAAAFHRWGRGAPRTLLARLLGFLGGSILISLIPLALSSRLYPWLRRLGDAPGQVLLAELIVAATVFALPTLAMGALFSLVLQEARISTDRIGSALVWNTVGAALGPVLTLALLPILGSKGALLLMAGLYVLLSGWFQRSRWLWLLLLPLGLAVSVSLVHTDRRTAGRQVHFTEGIMASVAVLEDAQGHRTLRVDNRYQMGGTGAADAEYRQAHLPLLLHPNPHNALLLGIGTGISLGAASIHPELHATGVELVPEVIRALPFFGAKNYSIQDNPRIQILAADARRFVRTSSERFDVVIADLFHPYRDGAGTLYTREHFAAIRNRLNTNGLFCQWLPLHQLDGHSLRVVLQTFLAEFPATEAWLLRFNVDVPVLALLGANQPFSRPAGLVESRLGTGPLAGELRRLALGDSLRLHGHALAGAAALREFAASAPLNTDDRQRITFLAPRAAYQRSAPPYESLLELLRFLESKEENALGLEPPADLKTNQRLWRYQAARNRYLHGLIFDHEEKRAEALNAYLESTRLSPDFTSGYAQCLSLANLLVSTNPQEARRILESLAAAQPDRPVARQLLEKLFPPR